MKEPLAWYIAGPLLGLMVPLLLFLREKQLGISSSYRYILGKLKVKNEYFNYPLKSDAWQVQFAFGLVLIGSVYAFAGNYTAIQPIGEIAPHFYSLSNWPLFLSGGVLVGFGARYANGCTAGHCVMGLSQLSPASLLATLGFFSGGLIVTYLIIPFIF